MTSRPLQAGAVGLGRRARGRTRTWLAVLVVLGLLAAAAAGVAGWQLGRDVAPAPEPAPAFRSISVGPVDLRVASSWTESRLDRTVLAGSGAAGARAYTFAPGVPAYALVTVGAPDHPSLLPAALRTAIAGALPRPVTIRLGTRPAWLYSGVRTSRRDQLMDVSVVPTTGGVLAVACVANVGWSAVCRPYDVERITPRQGRTLRPTEDLAFRAGLGAEVARLDRARATAGQELGAARTRGTQARALRRLAGAYERTAAQLGPLAPVAGPPAAAMTALQASADALRDAARAANADAADRYATARERATRAEAALADALAGIAPLDAA